MGLSSSFNDKQEPGLVSVCIEPRLLTYIIKNEHNRIYSFMSNQVNALTVRNLFNCSVSFISRLTLSALNAFIG